MRNKKILGCVLALALAAAGCAKAGSSDTLNPQKDNEAPQIAAMDVSSMFSDRDYEIGYDESQSAIIELKASGAVCDSDAVKISDNTVTIMDKGTYLIQGTLDDGMIIVEAHDKDKVQLVLDGARISNKTSAAIYVKTADKVFITTAKDSENTLSTVGEYKAIDDNNIDAVIFSKADLTLNGAGKLEINAAYGHGVVSKDDLVITSGVYRVHSKGHGFSGKDSVRIANGSFTIDAQKDGFHAENKDDASLGFMYIADGSFDLTTASDGLSSASGLQIDEGSFTILAGGGSAQASTRQSGFGNAATASQEDSVSMKGIKAAADLVINGGDYKIDCEDDAVHSNSNIELRTGSFEISTGDDGFHADENLCIRSGSILILKSYEGLEGQSINIYGGEIQLISSDDGLNAAGGNDSSGFGGFEGRKMQADSFSSDSNTYINISGGVVNIDASGDGIDSNGSLMISGGEIYVNGPDTGGDGALDYDQEASITGGVIIAVGASQMAQNFGETSTQGSMMVTVSSQKAGSEISLMDADGNEIITWTAAKAFDSVVISTPEIKKGASYTLKAGDSETNITMDSLIYGSGGMGAFGAGPGGNPDARPQGDGKMPNGAFKEKPAQGGTMPRRSAGESQPEGTNQ